MLCFIASQFLLCATLAALVACENKGNNIDVDPTFKCHAERSRSIYLKRGLRSNAFGDVANAHCEIKTSFISLAQSQHSLSFRRVVEGLPEK